MCFSSNLWRHLVLLINILAAFGAVTRELPLWEETPEFLVYRFARAFARSRWTRVLSLTWIASSRKLLRMGRVCP